jgi:hypothetical protein
MQYVVHKLHSQLILSLNNELRAKHASITTMPQILQVLLHQDILESGFWLKMCRKRKTSGKLSRLKSRFPTIYTVLWRGRVCSHFAPHFDRHISRVIFESSPKEALMGNVA